MALIIRPREHECDYCDNVATHEVEDSDSGEVILTCDYHKHTAFS